jgi:hypothetical protein
MTFSISSLLFWLLIALLSFILESLKSGGSITAAAITGPDNVPLP